jgi:hypothetical protein
LIQVDQHVEPRPHGVLATSNLLADEGVTTVADAMATTSSSCELQASARGRCSSTIEDEVFIGKVMARIRPQARSASDKVDARTERP